MELQAVGTPLVRVDRPLVDPEPGEVRVRVYACAVCRTDLHVVDGELPEVRLPCVPGHQVVGSVERLGAGVSGLAVGQRVGIGWLGATCGHCRHCARDRENLCDEAIFTGHTRDGGYADHLVADARFCFALSEDADPVAQAPLLCAGLIGHRCLRMAGDARRLGLYGFGAAAHIVAQVARFEGREVYAFTRPGDVEAQAFARELGAVWAGSSDEPPPEPLDAAILFAPIGALVPTALRAVDKGGIVVCGGIHMSDVPAFPYRLLWEERQIRSVANLTRRDARAFLELAPRIPVHTETTVFDLEDANEALHCLRTGQLRGAAVLSI